jgi:pimeloyl-ACP methyl ester carboxylesterase
MANSLMLPTTLSYLWLWQGQQLQVAYSIFPAQDSPHRGNGKSVLLLPAFSTVSSREEVAEVATILASEFQVTTVDFPGFGDSDRPQLQYNPELYQQFITDFIRDVMPQPLTVVATGHTAGYVMKLAHQQPQLFEQIVLVAPTWRGPLPTMMKGQKPWFKIIRELVRSPLLGQVLYQVNITPSFLQMMYQRHVYATAANITPALIAHKRQITQQKGARFAPAAFVTGGLDPVNERETFQSFFQNLQIPLLLIIGDDCPPKSKAEMESIAQLPGVITVTLPGTLGMHEEYAPQVATEIRRVIQP